MSPRTAAIVIGILDCVAAAALAVIFFNSSSDPATKGFDILAGWITIAVFCLTAAPALILALLRRAPRASLAFALGFPTSFALLFVAAVIAFAII
jgi:hypothetical protein